MSESVMLGGLIGIGCTAIAVIAYHLGMLLNSRIRAKHRLRRI
jgi:hypothetical protein